MSINRKYITADKIIRLFESGGSSMVVDFITRDCDATIINDEFSGIISGLVNELRYTEMIGPSIENAISFYKLENDIDK